MEKVKKHVLSCMENLAKLQQQMKFIYNTPRVVSSDVILVLKMMEPLIFGVHYDTKSALSEIHSLERAERETGTVKE